MIHSAEACREAAPTDDERASVLNDAEEGGETTMKNGIISNNPSATASIAIRTLPPVNSSAMIVNANNNMNNGNLF